MVELVVDKALKKIEEKAGEAVFNVVIKLVTGKVAGHMGDDTLSSKIRKLISPSTVAAEEAIREQIKDYMTARDLFNEGN